MVSLLSCQWHINHHLTSSFLTSIFVFWSKLPHWKGSERTEQTREGKKRVTKQTRTPITLGNESDRTKQAGNSQKRAIAAARLKTGTFILSKLWWTHVANGVNWLGLVHGPWWVWSSSWWFHSGEVTGRGSNEVRAWAMHATNTSALITLDIIFFPHVARLIVGRRAQVYSPKFNCFVSFWFKLRSSINLRSIVIVAYRVAVVRQSHSIGASKLYETICFDHQNTFVRRKFTYIHNSLVLTELAAILPRLLYNWTNSTQNHASRPVGNG